MAEKQLDIVRKPAYGYLDFGQPNRKSPIIYLLLGLFFVAHPFFLFLSKTLNINLVLKNDIKIFLFFVTSFYCGRQ